MRFSRRRPPVQHLLPLIHLHQAEHLPTFKPVCQSIGLGTMKEETCPSPLRLPPILRQPLSITGLYIPRWGYSRILHGIVHPKNTAWDCSPKNENLNEFFLLDSKEDILKKMGNQVVDGIDFHCVLWKSMCLALWVT